MAKRYSEFYKGKKKRRVSPAVIVAIVLIFAVVFLLLLFYALQKYIVITNDGLFLELPFLNESSHIEVSDEGGNVKVFDPVSIELITGEADYSNITAYAGEELTTSVKGVYIPASRFSADTVRREAEGLEYGNALILEVKPASGMLVYNSGVDFATAFATAGQVDLKSLVAELKAPPEQTETPSEDGEEAESKELYLIADICCLIDNTVPDRNPNVALRDESGEMYADSEGKWVDPYNADYRKYIVSLCRELSDMGFDEILLSGVRHPVSDKGFVYPATTNENVTHTMAVSGFALSITRSLRNLDAALSIRLNSDAAFANGEDKDSGQSADLYFKVFDRIYYYTEISGAQAAVESAEKYIELGDVNLRFVPVTYGGTPKTECWMYTEG